MADPLSFTASIIAVTTLAEIVVTKGRRYIKAVKNCQSDVRTLMAEVDVLCGALGRLSLRLQTEATENSSGDDEDGGEQSAGTEDSPGDVEEDSDADRSPLHPPAFIYECQKTLTTIQNVLESFRHKALPSIRQPTGAKSSGWSSFRHIESKDLKWPLKRQETMDLIQSLERHKMTCTLALAGDGTVAVHEVLEGVKLTNRHLAELRAGQSKILDAQLTKEQDDALHWLSPVNPAYKFQDFRKHRQENTGSWIFDLPEMGKWLETANMGLWIYGIPGSGKTILSTLVIDEVLTRKRSSSVGTAYFYVRYDDSSSQKPANILGSLISQLARQRPDALQDAMALHARHNATEALKTLPTDAELSELLTAMSKYFNDTYILIDGLDECGSMLDLDRTHLIDIISRLSQPSAGTIRTIVFSRNESDIRERLVLPDFLSVSIAATSADLRLFVNSWLPHLKVKNSQLRAQIVDTLVDKADGMFMWVRAQIDLLRRLPNDHEKKEALEHLPPDLPQTYMRIFERIDTIYPESTQKFIQRTLKWLVYQNPWLDDFTLTSGVPPVLTTEALTHAIGTEPLAISCENKVPDCDDITSWLGCLIRHVDGEFLQLSHFSVKEFLLLPTDKVASVAARKYLVAPTDIEYIADTCLQYLMYDRPDELRDACMKSDLEDFEARNPFFSFAARTVCHYLNDCEAFTATNLSCLRRFLTVPECPPFNLWKTYLDGFRKFREEVVLIKSTQFSALHFACLVSSKSEVQRLISEGAVLNPNDELFSSPLYLALAKSSAKIAFLGEPQLYRNFFLGAGGQLFPRCDIDDARWEITTLLIAGGADVNQLLRVKYDDDWDTPQYITVSPLTLALLDRAVEICCLLVEAGAEPRLYTARGDEGLVGLLFINGLADSRDDIIETTEILASKTGKPIFQAALDEWREDENVSDAESTQSSSSERSQSDIQKRRSSLDVTSSTNLSDTAQELIAQLYDSSNQNQVRAFIQSVSKFAISINIVDAVGYSAIHWASTDSTGDWPNFILDHGGDPNMQIQSSKRGPIHLAAQRGLPDNIESLLHGTALVDMRDKESYTAFHCAISQDHLDVAKLLARHGAYVNATLSGGSNALHIAGKRCHLPITEFLISQKVNVLLNNNYGVRPIHVACAFGFDAGVVALLKAGSEQADIISGSSDIYGTPLYTAVKNGHLNIVRLLLEAGANVDKSGVSGNLLGSALMAACASGHIEVVKLLLSRGAQRAIPDAKFKSAYGTARAFKRYEVMELLGPDESEQLHPSVGLDERESKPEQISCELDYRFTDPDLGCSHSTSQPEALPFRLASDSAVMKPDSVVAGTSDEYEPMEGVSQDQESYTVPVNGITKSFVEPEGEMNRKKRRRLEIA